MREKIKLVSSAKTGHYYTTTKNKKNTPDKIEIKKEKLKKKNKYPNLLCPFDRIFHEVYHELCL